MRDRSKGIHDGVASYFRSRRWLHVEERREVSFYKNKWNGRAEALETCYGWSRALEIFKKLTATRTIVHQNGKTALLCK